MDVESQQRLRKVSLLQRCCRGCQRLHFGVGRDARKGSRRESNRDDSGLQLESRCSPLTWKRGQQKKFRSVEAQAQYFRDRERSGHASAVQTRQSVIATCIHPGAQSVQDRSVVAPGAHKCEARRTVIIMNCTVKGVQNICTKKVQQGSLLAERVSSTTNSGIHIKHFSRNSENRETPAPKQKKYHP